MLCELIVVTLSYRDPAKRPTSQEVLKHSFLLKHKQHSLESKVKKKTSS